MLETDNPGASHGAGGARTILVVEDHDELRSILVTTLREHGFNVAEAADGAVAFQMVSSHAPDLLITDIGLPGMDGLELMKSVRRAADIPVIFLTGRSEDSDKVVGLELGADDYLVKPVIPRELIARVNAVLRRSLRREPHDRLQFGDLTIDIATREVIVSGQLKELTAKEFDLLLHLVQSPKRVYSRQQLLHEVWGSDTHWQGPATVTEHISRLRKKIEVEPSKPRWLRTVRGVGYRFDPDWNPVTSPSS